MVFHLGINENRARRSPERQRLQHTGRANFRTRTKENTKGECVSCRRDGMLGAKHVLLLSLSFYQHNVRAISSLDFTASAIKRSRYPSRDFPIRRIEWTDNLRDTAALPRFLEAIYRLFLPRSSSFSDRRGARSTRMTMNRDG